MAEDRLNSQNLIDILVSKHGFKKENAETFLKEFFLLIEEGLEQDKIVKVKGLGTFKLIDVKSRESINVNTGERFEIQGHTKVSFTPEASLRDAVNKPFAHFETIILKDGVTFGEDLANEDDEPELNNETDSDDISPVIPVINQSDNIPELEPVIESTTIETEDIKPIETEEVETPLVSDETETVDEEISESEEKKVVEEEIPEETFVSAQQPKDSSVKAVIAAILITLIICGAAIIFIFFPNLMGDLISSKKLPTETVSTEKVLPIENTDSIMAAKNAAIQDSIVQASQKKTTLNKPERTTSSNLSKNVIPVNPDSTSYDIVGTKTSHKIQSGETLTRIALRYYGTKDLWPYLVKHNKSKIPNPDRVPVGTTIQIPELKKK
ncbi:HU family DNA-binding protein [Bacteroides sp. 519]|uniref:HU family DNA-binding protein n=1 Tax=Bacteroides sp. 519 TaxID=2302937 RepID=UPI0013D53D36|nr:HU family DNA-binding protein [Bacteroides sp. 519]NDV59964.1 peptidoglycan-binding protein LysM [Bacteroides sp. 519]